MIKTFKGCIELKTIVLNEPGPMKTFVSTKITATDRPNRFFVGPESYKAIEVGTFQIKSSGKNWITELKLPAKPDRVWLSVDFSWDFIFSAN